MLCSNADVQKVVGANAESCYFGNSPSFAEMKIAFNAEYTAAWVAMHITEVLKVVAAKDTISAEIIGIAAQDIVANYSWLRSSEFMLFCSRVRIGKYGKLSYGQVTIDDITSKIPQFLSERSKEMRMYERQRKDKEREREYAERQERCVSHTEAYRIINLAADGDVEAQHKLNDNPENWRYRAYLIEWCDIDKELKDNISRYFGISRNHITGLPTARFENHKYTKFLEGVEKGYYKIAE